ncbi:class I SAM-dependent DNA methyltransferase [Iningainema tapete]|uniref:Class I SAM-dependent methyltransferase n=1 Tax=Iningainema tapete BLCC-T55 TaxID=2748662 RepID=A0A8J7C7P2_9CYAN|nr:class I SAM-dependent methyltransferase [Iningainema tapete]MBD2775934.1 class I SAM-dependent methyltransferase [Iningainema tapete BLCC-T55]
MSVFGNYARYYDLLYQDKDYVGEAKFIVELLKLYAPCTQSILELGCGTGTHAILLAKENYQVYGVDLSSEMLDKASDRTLQLPQQLSSRLKFLQGDIRSIRLEQQFDCIISLFHVFSYQTTNEDLQAAFLTAKTHLKPGGVLIFDCWYGAAVLSDRPTVRIKRLEDEQVQITRIAEPIMHPNDNLVDVKYQVFIKDKGNGVVEELQETHRMRYLFKPEVELLLKQFEMELLESREWMTNKEPGFDTWGVYFVVRN